MILLNPNLALRRIRALYKVGGRSGVVWACVFKKIPPLVRRCPWGVRLSSRGGCGVSGGVRDLTAGISRAERGVDLFVPIGFRCVIASLFRL
jgi:hypothetical protein